MKSCLKLYVATAVAGLAGAGPVWAQGASQPNVGSPTVNVMNDLWGKHPGMRANHAKGEVAEGMFQPTPEAAKLSKATIFSGDPVPVLVRFSNSTGLPEIPDMDDDAAVYADT